MAAATTTMVESTLPALAPSWTAADLAELLLVEDAEAAVLEADAAAFLASFSVSFSALAAVLTAEIEEQAATRVVLVVIVARVTEAADALAW